MLRWLDGDGSEEGQLSNGSIRRPSPHAHVDLDPQRAVVEPSQSRWSSQSLSKHVDSCASDSDGYKNNILSPLCSQIPHHRPGSASTAIRPPNQLTFKYHMPGFTSRSCPGSWIPSIQFKPIQLRVGCLIDWLIDRGLKAQLVGCLLDRPTRIVIVRLTGTWRLRGGGS